MPLRQVRSPKPDPLDSQSFLHPRPTPWAEVLWTPQHAPSPHPQSPLCSAGPDNGTLHLAVPADPGPALQTDAQSWMPGGLQAAETGPYTVGVRPVVPTLGAAGDRKAPLAKSRGSRRGGGL